MADMEGGSLGGSGSVSADLRRGRSGSDGGVELLPTIHLDGAGSTTESVDREPVHGPPRKHSGAQRGRNGSATSVGHGSRRTSSDASARRGDLTRVDGDADGGEDTGAGAGADGAPGDGGAQAPPRKSVGYTADHLAAVMKPVALTMILASWIVANIREASQDAAIAEGLSVYMVYNEQPGEATGTLLGQSIINAIVIVCAICAVTFVLVLCYKYRCIKCMIGYLIFASASLLGYSGGFVVMTAFEVYRVMISWPTFIFLMYNFAIVGVVAVFWQKGIPRILTQGYLVAVSCIMAWIVVKLPEWTSWTLLVALALYDLCAVLTPCGPLRALVKLAQERPEQPIPGLLYEADVGGGRRSGPRDTFASGSSSAANGAARKGSAQLRKAADQRRSAEPAQVHGDSGRDFITAVDHDRINASNHSTGMVAASMPGVPHGGSAERLVAVSAAGTGLNGSGDARAGSPAPGQSAARAAPTKTTSPGQAHRSSRQPVNDSYVAMPEAEETYEYDSDESEEGPGRSIKLGLGDFVFYSVLVSRAALFGFATFAACFVAVIMGLVGTLLLLGIFKKALPALPISIALGVTFYFTTRLVLFPMIVSLAVAGVST